MHDEEHIDYAAVLPPRAPVITPERRKARNVVAIEGERGGRQYRSLTSPLDFYLARMHITPCQYQAGDRLRRIFNASILRERYVRMSYGDVGGHHDPVDHALAPRDFLRAVAAIRDERERQVVRMVCCEEKCAGKGAPMTRLKGGLDDLVRHFKIHD